MGKSDRPINFFCFHIFNVLVKSSLKIAIFRCLNCSLKNKIFETKREQKRLKNLILNVSSNTILHPFLGRKGENRYTIIYVHTWCSVKSKAMHIFLFSIPGERCDAAAGTRDRLHQ